MKKALLNQQEVCIWWKRKICNLQKLYVWFMYDKRKRFYLQKFTYDESNRYLTYKSCIYDERERFQTYKSF